MKNMLAFILGVIVGASATLACACLKINDD